MILDFSLSLINRTGAYYIGKDLVDAFGGEFREIRYWRLGGSVVKSTLARKIVARLMFLEMNARIRHQMPPRSTARDSTIYLDPLYVITGGLSPQDVVLCHDIGPITHPELYSDGAGYRFAYDYIQSVKPGVVFVSDASRDAFSAAFGRDFRFLETIPLYTRSGVLAGETARPDAVQGPYILCVGAVGRRKNQVRLIEGFRQSGLAERGLSLILVGSREYGFDAVADAQRHTSGVTLLPYTTDAELRWLYANAAAFCLPSLLEGFGMPALEAASHQTLNIVSEGGALAEAIGGHGLLVDPTSVSGIAEALVQAFEMDAVSRSRITGQALSHAKVLSRQRFLDSWSQLISQQTS